MEIKEITEETDLIAALADLREFVLPDFRCDIGQANPHLPEVEYVRNFLANAWGFLGYSNGKCHAMGLLIPHSVDGHLVDVQFYWLFGDPAEHEEFVTDAIYAALEKAKPDKPEIWGIFSRKDFAESLYANDLYSKPEDIDHPALFGKTDFSGYPIRFEG